MLKGGCREKNGRESIKRGRIRELEEHIRKLTSSIARDKQNVGCNRYRGKGHNKKKKRE